jgi:hypothetical protein
MPERYTALAHLILSHTHQAALPPGWLHLSQELPDSSWKPAEVKKFNALFISQGGAQAVRCDSCMGGLDAPYKCCQHAGPIESAGRISVPVALLLL